MSIHDQYNSVSLQAIQGTRDDPYAWISVYFSEEEFAQIPDEIKDRTCPLVFLEISKVLTAFDSAEKPLGDLYALCLYSACVRFSASEDKRGEADNALDQAITAFRAECEKNDELGDFFRTVATCSICGLLSNDEALGLILADPDPLVLGQSEPVRDLVV